MQTNKKILLVISITSLFSAAILLILISMTENSGKSKNAFERKITQSVLTPLAVSKLLKPCYKICSITDNNIFLASNNLQSVIITDINLKNQKETELPFPINNKILSAFDISIDSPFVNLYSGNTGRKYYCKLGDTTGYFIGLPLTLFTRVSQINDHTTIFRAFDSTRTIQLFQKINITTGKKTIQPSIMEKQTDAGFATDGLLTFDKVSNLILYVQYYQNRFFCIDTNLNLRYTGKTIDTTNANLLHTRSFVGQERGSIMPSVPLKPIFQDCFASNNRLYIVSTLKADNEKDIDFQKNSIVDVYSIITGEYISSFYIPKNGEKLLKIYISNNILVCMYNESIATFRLG